MIQTILCPHCQKEIEINEVITHQIRERELASIQSEHKKEIEAIKRDITDQTTKRISEQLSLELKNKENEAKELKERNTQLQQQLLDIHKTLREMKTKDEQRDLEMQKQVLEKEKEIKEQTVKQFTEEHRLKDLEKDKQLSDMLKQIEELKQKAQQGSMQMQGEVLELDLEETLRRLFPEDSIEPIGKGVNGADIRHIVKSSLGTVCGIILWESKRTKHWSDEWISKLKEDLRNEKAHIPALVSIQLPEEAKKGIGQKDGVWICTPSLMTPTAILLRKVLYDAAKQKFIASQSQTQAQEVFSYITSHEFAQQIEAMVETFAEMREQIAKERLVLEKTLTKREAQLTRLMKSTTVLYGNLQGRIGQGMPQIKGLELPSLEE